MKKRIGAEDLQHHRGMAPLVAWRGMKRWVNPLDALTMKERIDVEGFEYKRVVHKRLRAVFLDFFSIWFGTVLMLVCCWMA